MSCIALVALHMGCIAWVALHRLHCMGCIAWVALHGLHCMGCIACVAYCMGCIACCFSLVGGGVPGSASVRLYNLYTFVQWPIHIKVKGI